MKNKALFWVLVVVAALVLVAAGYFASQMFAGRASAPFYGGGAWQGPMMRGGDDPHDFGMMPGRGGRGFDGFYGGAPMFLPLMLLGGLLRLLVPLVILGGAGYFIYLQGKKAGLRAIAPASAPQADEPEPQG